MTVCLLSSYISTFLALVQELDFLTASLTIVPGLNNDLRYAMLISAACPVGSNLAVYAQLHNKDYTYAVEAVAASTVICVVTIPLLVQLAGRLWIL